MPGCTVDAASAKEIRVSFAWEVNVDEKEQSCTTMFVAPRDTPKVSTTAIIGHLGHETLASDEIAVVTSILPHAVSCELKDPRASNTALVTFAVSDPDERLSGRASSFGLTGIWARGPAPAAYDIADLGIPGIHVLKGAHGAVDPQSIAEYLKAHFWPMENTAPTAGLGVDKAQMRAVKTTSIDSRLLVVEQTSALSISVDTLVSKTTEKGEKVMDFGPPRSGFVYALQAIVTMTVFKKLEISETSRDDE
jgi:hypothetical protein